MCVVSINVPEEVLLDLHQDKNDFADYMKKMLALDLYKNKKVSLGYCASVAEMTKEELWRDYHSGSCLQGIVHKTGICL